MDTKVTELIHEEGSNAYKVLVEKALSGEIPYPYAVEVGDAQQIKGKLANLSDFNSISSPNALRQSGYSSNYSLYMGKSGEPASFSGTDTATIYLTPRDWEDYTSAVEGYVERVRATTPNINGSTPMRCWKNNMCLASIMRKVVASGKLSQSNLKSLLYNEAKPVPYFPSTTARVLFKTLVQIGGSVLDTDARWGGKLLGALSLNLKYVGFSDSSELTKNLNKMVVDSVTKSKDTKVVNGSIITNKVPGKFSAVIVSEYYKEGDYGSFDDWVVGHLFQTLSRAWEMVADGGYLVLHYVDIKGKRANEASNLFIEQHLHNSSWIGMLGLGNKEGKQEPCWVWRKSDDGKLWLPKIRRSLSDMYPLLYDKVVKSYVMSSVDVDSLSKTLDKYLDDAIVGMPPVLVKYAKEVAFRDMSTIAMLKMASTTKDEDKETIRNIVIALYSMRK